jgi:hypothetical protein
MGRALRKIKARAEIGGVSGRSVEPLRLLQSGFDRRV